MGPLQRPARIGGLVRQASVLDGDRRGRPGMLGCRAGPAKVGRRACSGRARPEAVSGDAPASSVLRPGRAGPVRLVYGALCGGPRRTGRAAKIRPLRGSTRCWPCRRTRGMARPWTALAESGFNAPPWPRPWRLCGPPLRQWSRCPAAGTPRPRRRRLCGPRFMALTMANSSRGVRPSGFGLPTPGAKPGSSTSMSKLAYMLPKPEIQSLQHAAGPAPPRTCPSVMQRIPDLLRGTRPPLRRARGPPTWSMEPAPRSSTILRR